MSVKLEILEIVVIERAGSADTVFVKFQKPSPLPALSDEPLTMKFSAAEKTGALYVKACFDFAPTIIN